MMDRREVKISLQYLWLKRPGTYYCKVAFTSNNQSIETQLQNEGSYEVVDLGTSWRIGPLVVDSSSNSPLNLKNIEFVAEVSHDSMHKPCHVNLQVFQEVSNPSPTTSKEHSAETTELVLIGTGTLQISHPTAWHFTEHGTSPKIEESVQRINITGKTDVGSLPVSFGWLKVASIIHEETNESEQEIEEITTKKSELYVKEKSFEELRSFSEKVVHQSSNIHIGYQPSNIRASPLPEPKESFPSIDAVQQILPKYFRLANEPMEKEDPSKPYCPIIEPTQSSTPSNITPGARLPADDPKAEKMDTKQLDQHVISVLEFQTRELDRYRAAIRQMGELVVTLRGTISDLEMKNNQLRSELYYKDASYLTDNDQFRKNRMAEQIEEQKILLQKQQNDLMIKNEYESKYLKLLKAHQSQQSLLQDYQAKISKYQRLQKVCQRQEKVISELESSAKKSTQDKKRTPESVNDKSKTVAFESDGNSTASASNAPLFSSKESSPQKQQRVHLDQSSGVEDRVFLLQRLEKSEGRIIALEKQMFDNARQWAREKSHLKLKAAESLGDTFDIGHRLPLAFSFPSEQIGRTEYYYPFPSLKGGQDTYRRLPHI